MALSLNSCYVVALVYTSGRGAEVGVDLKKRSVLTPIGLRIAIPRIVQLDVRYDCLDILIIISRACSWDADQVVSRGKNLKAYIYATSPRGIFTYNFTPEKPQ
ncbi:uncharacterized protein PHACADRAFT_255095 [Phanerochaete carnosa HHB-10118-sp]|uniref:Uncharacterized protein n=1 Tax=Phanerochaete carnosa (strain HHB-10118-sp) TaxID=650164 RepID=K5W0N4_PHACS|nr:uncharacterized protein PHACADRAFT_255095 [Phanerochaete carnosa HHB-10118-sp]EKM57373.1 hypothetical protein PHACADRAFT_255095 [Phanerochaete carnosa HHB-10118-sp]